MVRDVVCGASGCVLEPIAGSDDNSRSSDQDVMVQYTNMKQRPSITKKRPIKQRSKPSQQKKGLKGGGAKPKRSSPKKTIKRKAPILKRRKISPAKKPTKSARDNQVLEIIKKLLKNKKK